MSNDDSDSANDTEQAAMAVAAEWYELFAQTPAFVRLKDSQQRKAGAIVEFFAQYAYTHVGVSPRQWDASAVVKKSPPLAGPYDPCPCGSGRKYKFCCKEKR